MSGGVCFCGGVDVGLGLDLAYAVEHFDVGFFHGGEAAGGAAFVDDEVFVGGVGSGAVAESSGDEGEVEGWLGEHGKGGASCKGGPGFEGVVELLVGLDDGLG